ncbi:TetR/AcrR family transcriptional regulator [Chamaesiphon sp. OTE_20_metabat_361]|uniref:TetR/AcrR family transcriptional regulator n=1 Tax=Chamaesiphon sp. OTE_20_metabat_361 TaxID=2964689 RepID=UPI00286B93A3|nr:TetR/AcrR family transcriptional regulator [Chamaesiphon sp. OTE_20_metabat_361]
MPKYHHGDLRNTLISIAIELLAEDGLQALSLRKMAQRAGVSHNAPYMHFADKEAVLVAIAAEGFRLLAVDVESAIARSGSSTRERLIAASQAYVRFALGHPDRVQVMFRPVDEAKYPSLVETSQSSLHRLFELVKSGQDRGELKAGDTQAMTKAIWAMAHGISAISIAYQTSIMSPTTSSEDLTSMFVSFLLDGLAA